MKQIILPFYARLAFILVSLISMGYIAYIGKDILAPLLFSLLVAMLLLPFCRFLEYRCRIPRSVATMFALMVFASAIAMLAFGIGTQLTMLIQDFPHLRRQIVVTLDDLRYWIQSSLHINVNQQIRKAESGAAVASPQVIGETVLSISGLILFGVFIFIYSFFMLFYRGLLMTFLIKVFSDDHQHTIKDITAQVQFIVKEYIVGLFLEMCAVATLVSSTLAILGVRYALLLGLITAIFNLIPYVGIFTAMGISFIITLGTLGLTKALMVGGAIILVHVLDSNFIMPRIVGSKVQINALAVVIGVVIGEMLWGLSGMFLSVPVIAIVKIIFDRVEELKPWGYLLGGLKRETTDGLERENPVEILSNEE